MKVFALLFWGVSTSFFCHAQGCPGVYFLKSEAEVVMTTYDRQEVVSGKTVYKITEAQRKGPELSSTAHILKTKQGRMTEEVARFYCNAGVLSVYLGKDKNGQEFFLDYPSMVSVGEHLGKDIDFTMETVENGKHGSVRIIVTNRQVAAIDELVSTPVGSWHCARITYDLQLKLDVSGIKLPVKLQVTEWFAPGYGVVKTESFKAGKLEERTLLTQLQYP